MIQKIFQITALTLLKIAAKTKLSYNEINIIVYYFIIPLSWAILVDIWLATPIISVLFVIFCAVVYALVRNNFKEWSDYIFKKSVDFLLYFNRFGSNYVLSSVVICIIVPIIVYIILFLLIV